MDTPMEVSFVVSWTEELGWYVDDESLYSRFLDGNVWIPQMNEWVKPGTDTEADTFEENKYQELKNKLF